jgi:hypothetical protein
MCAVVKREMTLLKRVMCGGQARRALLHKDAPCLWWPTPDMSIGDSRSGGNTGSASLAALCSSVVLQQRRHARDKWASGS